MKHKIVTVTLIFILDIFRPYTVIMSCSRYAKLFTALLIVVKIKIALKIQIKIGRPIRSPCGIY
jgi:hypothetical protein